MQRVCRGVQCGSLQEVERGEMRARARRGERREREAAAKGSVWDKPCATRVELLLLKAAACRWPSAFEVAVPRPPRLVTQQVTVTQPLDSILKPRGNAS